MAGQFGLVRRGCCGSQEERPFPAVGHLNRPIKNIKKLQIQLKITFQL